MSRHTPTHTWFAYSYLIRHTQGAPEGKGDRSISPRRGPGDSSAATWDVLGMVKCDDSVKCN